MGHYDECRDENCGTCGQSWGHCEHTRGRKNPKMPEEQQGRLIPKEQTIMFISTSKENYDKITNPRATVMSHPTPTIERIDQLEAVKELIRNPVPDEDGRTWLRKQKTFDAIAEMLDIKAQM